MSGRPRLVGINHVALEVGDLEEALAFYRGLFEVARVDREPGMAFLDMGGQFIALSEGRSAGPDESRHFGLVVDDKEAVRSLRPVSRPSARTASTSVIRGATCCRSWTTATSSSRRRRRCCPGWGWTPSRSGSRSWRNCAIRALPREVRTLAERVEV